jgi:simple sugar transport system permease protein
VRNRYRVVRRAEPHDVFWYRVGALVVGLILSLLIVPFFATVSVSTVYSRIWQTVATGQGVQNSLHEAIPLMFTGLAVAIPYRMRLWNIGGEGQIYLGGFAATGIAFTLPHTNGGLLKLLMILGAAGAGAAWIAVPALMRVYVGVNEIISTLLLNFVGFYVLVYWVSERWSSASVSVGSLSSGFIPHQSFGPTLNVGSVAVPWSLAGALGIAVAASFVLRRTILGYEIGILGASSLAGRFAGMPVKRRMMMVMLVGGACAGLAGAASVMDTGHALGDNISNNWGYSGIAVALLAAGSPLGVILIAWIFSLVTISGDALKVSGISSDFAFALIGMILFLAAIADSLTRYQLARVDRGVDVKRDVGPHSAQAPLSDAEVAEPG